MIANHQYVYKNHVQWTEWSTSCFSDILTRNVPRSRGLLIGLAMV